jgi:hypothetical protein
MICHCLDEHAVMVVIITALIVIAVIAVVTRR